MKTAALRWNATIYAGGTPSKDRADFWQDGTIPWLNSGAVNDWRINEPSALITEEALASSSARWIPTRSVVIALAGQGRTKGTAARLEVATTCNQSMAAIVPSGRLDYRYLHYVLHSMYEPIRNMAGGDLRDGLNLQHIGDIRIPVIPLEGQRRIADFLDDQVARIDKAIAARQRQVALVREQEEQVLESLLWPSGLASVELRRLGTSVTTGPFGTVFASSDYVSGGVPMINPTHILEGRLVPDDSHTVSPHTAARLNRHRLHPGDLVTGRKGDLGRSALVGPAEDGWICGSDSIAIHLDQRQLSPDYLELVLHLPRVRSELVANSPGATMPSLNEGMLLSLKVPLRALGDQHAVAKHVSRVRAESLVLRSALDESISRLREFWRSLTTSAVTGELDVTTARRELPV